jgi:hypothetical protein
VPALAQISLGASVEARLIEHRVQWVCDRYAGALPGVSACPYSTRSGFGSQPDDRDRVRELLVRDD